jgi:hypothetical protein
MRMLFLSLHPLAICCVDREMFDGKNKCFHGTGGYPKDCMWRITIKLGMEITSIQQKFNINSTELWHQFNNNSTKVLDTFTLCNISLHHEFNSSYPCGKE